MLTEPLTSPLPPAAGGSAAPASVDAAVAILGNPYGGSRHVTRVVGRLERALADRGLRTCVVWKRDDWPATLELLQFNGGCRCIVAAGGDGTIADVINLAPACPIAALPLGNENLFARHYGYTCDSQTFADMIQNGRCREVDLGVCGGRLFSLMVGAGFDAQVIHEVDPRRNLPEGVRRIRRYGYIGSVLATVRRYRFPKVTLEAAGESVTGVSAMVFNIPRYAMNLTHLPDAREDDGRLHWIVFQKPGVIRHALDLLAAIRGRCLDLPHVSHGSAASLRLTSEQGCPVPLQMDGEQAGVTPVDLQIKPRALRLLTPAAGG